MLSTAVPPPRRSAAPAPAAGSASARRTVGKAAYQRASEITGPLQESADRLQYRAVLTPNERRTATLLVAANVITGVGFIAWLMWPSHLPAAVSSGHGAVFVLGVVGFVLLGVVELVRLTQCVTLWAFTLRAQDPVPMQAPPNLRVAVLTTIVPGKEPLEIVARTLSAMRRLSYPGRVDVWILDEGDDPDVRRVARTLGVRHFSRRGRSEYNRAAGEFKAKTKAGNHNAWRAEHEHRYDVVAQMDPDHLPHPDFLTRTLGYFSDPDVAFVVAPQVYGNLHDGFVEHASAIQAYFFHGIIQRGGNGMEAPLLIGTNHLYRPSAWRAIGGYQDSIIEDHLTAMHVFAATNPATGHRYRGVYTPDVLAVGEGPASWTDFFNQQRRWAYGIWEILLKHSAKVLPQLRRSQRMAFALLQFFYPSVAAVWVLGNALTALVIVTGVGTIHVAAVEWSIAWSFALASSLGLFLWLRRFNLVEHERREWGIAGMAMLIATVPVYVSAACSALARRPLAYAVTAKGDLASPDRMRTFRPHLTWFALSGAAFVVATMSGHGGPTIRAWTVVTALLSVAPVVAWLWMSGRPPLGVTVEPMTTLLPVLRADDDTTVLTAVQPRRTRQRSRPDRRAPHAPTVGCAPVDTAAGSRTLAIPAQRTASPATSRTRRSHSDRGAARPVAAIGLAVRPSGGRHRAG